jgi:hypothetical protein
MSTPLAGDRPRFETDDPELGWLERDVFLAIERTTDP